MNILLFSCALVLVAMTGCAKNTDMSVLSPGGDIIVTFINGSEGFALYSVYYRDTAVTENSRLSLIRSDGDYSTGLQLESVSDLKQVDES